MRSGVSRPSGSACRCLTGLNDIEAASLPETFFTVWSNVFIGACKPVSFS